MDIPVNFEQQLEEIEAIVDQLESGKLSLGEMLSRYESGMQLIASCQQRLANAQLKVTEIADLTAAAAMADDDVVDDD